MSRNSQVLSVNRKITPHRVMQSETFGKVPPSRKRQLLQICKIVTTKQYLFEKSLNYLR